MTPADLSQLSASQAAAALRSGALTVERLAMACLDRIEVRDADIRAWAYLDRDLVLANARALDGSSSRGPLYGLPVGIKDIMQTADMPTQYNSPLYKGHFPTVDAACVSLLRSAGALIFGKTDTVEFAATGRRAATRNPYDLTHGPGGSSSGSAAAVADFQVPLSLGTQTAGSMVRPASFCGVWAMKPTWGLINREGSKIYSNTLDTIGWFARSADDLMLLQDVYDADVGDYPMLPIRGARIAVCQTPAWSKATEATRTALAAAADGLRQAGAIVTDLNLPSEFDPLPDQQTLIMRAEGRAAFLADARAHPGQLEPRLQEMVDNTDGHTRSGLLAAYDAAALRRSQFDAIASGFDAVIAPSAPGEAPLGLEDVGDPVFNGMWTLLHVPTVNVPAFTGPQGLPVGITVIGPRFADRKALAAAKAVGTALGL